MMEIIKGFIVLEGLDGAGTTTQKERLEKELGKRGYDIWSTAEPTSSDIGRLIRRVLKGDLAVPELTLAHLFAADRADHIYGCCGIIENIENGKIVISDRYFYSTLAYQSFNIGLEKIAEHYGDRFETVFKSVTSDNGSEFVDLGSYLPKSTKVYYAHPYSSYERGTNEKQNSLVRRFFPKGKSFDNITDEQVAFVEHWINHLPRKIFNYHFSDFVFHNVLFDIAI